MFKWYRMNRFGLNRWLTFNDAIKTNFCKLEYFFIPWTLLLVNYNSSFHVSTSAFSMRDHEIKLTERHSFHRMNIENVYGTSIKVIVNTKYCALNDHKFGSQILFIHSLNNIHKLTLARFQWDKSRSGSPTIYAMKD